MLDRRTFLTTGVALGSLVVTTSYAMAQNKAQKMTTTDTIDFKGLSEAEWRQRLNSAQFDVLRKHGTERAGTSPLNHEKRKGVFACAGCDLPLFSSDTKFESGTGRASTSRSRTRSLQRPTVRSSWCALRCIAVAARAISATYSMTDRSRLVCATA